MARLWHATGTDAEKARDLVDQRATPVQLTCGFVLERVTRIELALSAWEADVLPLNYTRESLRPDPPSP